MKQALGSLAWLTLAFVGGLIVIVLLLIWANSSNAAEGGLGWGILLGFLFLLAIAGCTLTALILGITGCRAARQNQRWGWFVSFLTLTILVVLGVLSYSFWRPIALRRCAFHPPRRSPSLLGLHWR